MAMTRFPRTLLLRIALVAVTAHGVVAIVGCGGDAPQCSFFSNVCNPVISPTPAMPIASIYPIKLTVQAGGSAVFTAQTVGIDQPSFQCRRSADAGTLRMLRFVAGGIASAPVVLLGTPLRRGPPRVRVGLRRSRNDARADRRALSAQRHA